MRRMVPIPLSVLIDRLPADAPVFVFGCGDCATREHYGGAEECRATAEELRAAGVEVVGWAAPAPGEATCNVAVARAVVAAHAEVIARADVILLLACPQGEPAVARATRLPVVQGVQAITGGLTGGGAMTVEDCDLCEQCIARAAGGLCPHAYCPKQLINGPCGGAQGGRCEVFPNRPCVWESVSYTHLTLPTN